MTVAESLFADTNILIYANVWRQRRCTKRRSRR